MIAGSCLDTGKTLPGKNIVANWSLCQREVFYKVLIAFNMPESEAFFKILSTFKKQTHLHIDCKGAVGRWWCGATAENTLPLLILSIYAYKRFINIRHNLGRSKST